MPDRSFLEWPFFDDSHRALASRLEAWCASSLGNHSIEGVDDQCRKNVISLSLGGWLEYAAPASGAIAVRSLCLIRETLARHSGLTDFSFALQGLGSGAITLFGSEELKDAYLPGVRRGESIAAFALSEPEAGSDVSAIGTIAKRDGDDFVL